MATPAKKSPITCHVLDSTLGQPGKEIGVFVERYEFAAAKYNMLGEGSTDQDGRCTTLLDPSTPLAPGLYKITFKTGDYFVAQNRESFYPIVEITFHVAKADDHYHIPLLLSPWSYTTYRGS
ncbi:Hydroxyisourate hydrolase [Clavulina sp. PMI_390]|nr:Hydroxyisourate hydrolase [Clavulina sp. PMI_390]